jgi:hypothetical protein
MDSTLHKIAGILALLMISSFWLSTATSELLLDEAAIVAVKTAVPWGFLLLVPTLAMAGATGFRLGKGRTAGLIGAKRKRMPFIAANGVLVLVPAALFLAAKARAGAFDATFLTVQGVELVAGAVNILLMTLNIRDGRRMTAGRRRAK